MEEEAVEGIRRLKLPLKKEGVTRVRPKNKSTDAAQQGRYEGSERLMDMIQVACPTCLHRREEEVPMLECKVGDLAVHECPVCGSVLLDGDNLDIHHYEDDDGETFIVYDEHGKAHRMDEE